MVWWLRPESFLAALPKRTPIRDQLGHSTVVLAASTSFCLSSSSIHWLSRFAGILELRVGATGQITWEMKPAAEVPPTEEFRPTVLMEKISRAIEKTPGMTKSKLEKAVNGKAEDKRQAP